MTADSHEELCAVGVHFSDASARAVVARASDGALLGRGEAAFPHGLMCKQLTTGPRASSGHPSLLPRGWALHVPADYATALARSVAQAMREARGARVVGIGLDLPGGAVMPIARDGTPLCEVPGFGDHPHAYAKADAHDSCAPQARRIAQVALERAEPWIDRLGGVPAKDVLPRGLQILEQDPAVYRAMDRLAQSGDWLVGRLTGEGCPRRTSAAARGALACAGHLPSEDFLDSLNPDFGGFAREKLAGAFATPGETAGSLTPRAAAALGLPAGIAVAPTGVDLEAWALGVGAVDAGQAAVVAGGATRVVANAAKHVHMAGALVAAQRGVGEDLWTYEASQPGVRAELARLLRRFLPARYAEAAEGRGEDPASYMGRLAAAHAAGEGGLVAFFGRGVRARASGMLVGITPATRVEDVYRALLESWAYRLRDLVESFERAGVAIRDLSLAGECGVDPLAAQILADVIGRAVSIGGGPDAAALGSAMQAAAAAGVYPGARAAARAMRAGGARRSPEPTAMRAYEDLYVVYRLLAGSEGGVGADVLGRLDGIRRRARGARRVEMGEEVAS